MIIKAHGDTADKEADYLANCLNSVTEYVDDIFITLTYKKGTTINQKCRDVAEYYKANISEYEWQNNFAHARNFNFSQVPQDYDYIMWLDADDILIGGDKLRSTIEEHDNVDAFSLWYQYAFDEHGSPVVIHHKTQIVRNDGCVEWAGHLHEDFKENRMITKKHVEGITRVHTSKDEHFEEAKERNLTVALEQKKEMPNDPRSYWNTGNSYKAMGMHEEALAEFEYFLKTSLSEEEKYIVHMRISESLWALQRKEEAVNALRLAIGLRPEYPDAYILLGQLFYHSERYTDAVAMLKTGLNKKPPYYQIMVYNPRDYDYTPLRWLALSYVAISQPMLAYECFKAMLQITPNDKNLETLVNNMKVESDKYDKILKTVESLSKETDKKKLKKKFDKIPDDYKYHPLVCKIRNTNFIKEESSGKDVVILCGYTERQWDGSTAEKEGIGGSEEAVTHLSKRLVKRGYNVTVYNNCGHKESVHDGVTYRPFMAWNYRDKQDVTIIWRHPRMLENKINSTKVFIDMHDMVPAGEFTPKRLANVDKVFVKSDFHRSIYPNVPEEKVIVVPNGIESLKFDSGRKKEKFLMVNTSSPDRSLTALIKGFKKVKERVPEAKCEWAYGWGVFDTVHKENAELMKWKDKTVSAMEEAGIVNRGRLNHGEVQEMYERATVFAYPSEFAEIDCISLTKAMASGAIPVTTDFSAMGGKQGHGGYFIHSDKNKDTWCKPYQYDFSLEDENKLNEWVDACVKALTEPHDTQAMEKYAKETYDWERVTDVWEANIK